MTADQHYDVAVVGLGLIGSGALRALADAGQRCVGVGPAEPADWSNHPGVFASHYDSGRITRHLDRVREWGVLAARSIAGYADLEARSGIAFHRPVGVVLAVPADEVAAITAVAEELAVDLSTYAPDAASDFDSRLSFPSGSTLLAEPGPAGHIDPRRMLRANLAVATAGGATIVREAASSLRAGSSGWTVTTATGVLVTATRVVVATGAHSDELRGLAGCPAFDVRGETIVMATLGPDEQARLAGLPSILAELDDPTYDDLYVVPPTDYPDGSVRLKLGATRHDMFHVHDGAARREWMSDDRHRDELDALRDLLTTLVPGLAAESWETKPCLITQTASGLPVVDHLAPGLVLAAGGNGYAAKSANAIGALAAQLVVDGAWTDPDLDHRRFEATRRVR